MASRLEEDPSEPGYSKARSPDTPSVVLTPMRRRHLRGVLRIEGQVYPRPWSPGLFAGELTLTDSRIYVVARIGAAVAGYGGLMTVVDDGHITTIAVDPAWQRHRVGTRIMLQLVDAALGRGVEQLTLEVRPSNRHAQELYRKFGFAPAGVRRGYYADNGEDALVMWAHDVRTDGYAKRLTPIRAAVAGTTVVEGFDR